MDEHDTFPQRVWQIVASIPEGCVTTYGEVARLAGSARGASGRRRAKEATRRKHVTVAPGRQSPWRHFPHRARLAAPASGFTFRRGAGVRGRTN